MLFARKNCCIAGSFKSIKTVKVKTGTKGITANKGAVAIRFNFEDTSFMFMNTHLTSGQKKSKERIADTKLTYSGVTQVFDQFESQPVIPGIHDSFKRTQQDYQFIFGDMNFRCDLQCQEAKDLAAQNEIANLRVSDQLLKAMGGDDLLWRFREEQIKFLPTFKYDKNSDVYDTSKKQRTPSYTDRILFSINDGQVSSDFSVAHPSERRANGNQVIVDYYNRRESQFSDHRPVLGIFQVGVRKVNHEKLGQIKNEILAQIQSGRQQS